MIDNRKILERGWRLRKEVNINQIISKGKMITYNEEEKER